MQPLEDRLAASHDAAVLADKSPKSRGVAGEWLRAHVIKKQPHLREPILKTAIEPTIFSRIWEVEAHASASPSLQDH